MADDSMLKKILKKVGLTTHEIAVYLTGLKVGTQNVATLAKETGISRHDANNALRKLKNRGFVREFSNKKNYFTAEPPEVILKILKEDKKTLPASLTLLNQHFPLFEAYISPLYIKPEITFYEGKEGIITAYEDTLTSRTEIHAIASIDDIESVLPRYVPRYYQRRKTAGILMKAIFPDTKMARARQVKDKEELRISRLIPDDKYFFTMEINIYDQKVAFFSHREELAIIIKSAEIATNMQHMFKLCWEMAKPFSHKNLSAKKNKVRKNLKSRA